jgi:hypothetical protein
MTEGKQDRPGVNLEDLEQQLRMASRSHGDEVVRSNSPSAYSENIAPTPDLNALRRDYTHAEPIPAPPASNFSDEFSDPGPPPAFLSAPAHGTNQSEYANSYDDRFPLIDRRKKRSSFVVRVRWSLIVVLLLGSFGYLFYLGKILLSGSTIPDQKSVPVIKADPNPVKIVPEANPTSDAAPKGSELFGKKGADTASSATTKSTVEAPVDVNTAVKANANKSNSLVPGMGEPKSVRTVTVRPDGTLIGEPTAGAAPAASNPTPVIVTPSPSAMAQEAPQTVAPASSPAATPPAKALPSAAEAAPSLPASPTGAATINSSPVPLPPPRPPLDLLAMKAVDDPLKDLVAQATNPDAAPAKEVAQPADAESIGDYGVQFGATPSETEANALSVRLKTQLADLLGDHKIAVIKADSNGKAIYRVRALGYSRDEAAAACASAAASGTKCFIAKN